MFPPRGFPEPKCCDITHNSIRAVLGTETPNSTGMMRLIKNGWDDATQRAFYCIVHELEEVKIALCAFVFLPLRVLEQC